MIIKPDDRLLFTGASIVEHNRDRSQPEHLGLGFVGFIGARLRAYLPSYGLKIFNRGMSGNRVVDLLGRIDEDLLDLKPTVVSIQIGANDVARRYDSNDPTSAKAFENSYRGVIEKIRERGEAQIVLLEPFMLQVSDDRHAWREDLNPKIDVVRRLAVEYGADLIPLDSLFARAVTQAPPTYWAADGTHPGPAGDALIAEAWLENAGLA
jgi:lysophospholipase L1-like esterase